MDNVDLLHHLDIGLITTWYMGSCKLKVHETYTKYNLFDIRTMSYGVMCV